MDLKDAFGDGFNFTYKTKELFQPTRLGVGDTKDPQDPITQDPIKQDPITQQESSVNRHIQHIRPDVYLLQVQINRDDCHLLCMFLLVFTISFILSNKKQ